MIMKSIRDSFRRQEWATVLLELAVVVLGIFLALQAENWNQSRLAAQQEDRVLDLLREDFVELRAQTTSWIDTNIGQARTQTVVATALSQGEIPAGEEETFRYGLQTLVYSLPPPQNSGTLEGLVASGGLATISDPDLRRSLFRFQEYLERVEQQMVKFENLLQVYRDRTTLVSVQYAPLPLDQPHLWMADTLATRSDRPVSGVEPKVSSYDLAALSADPKIQRSFVEVADAHLAAVQWGLGLREHIDTVLGRLPRPRGD